MFIETGLASLNKYGEELCGDCVEIARTDDAVIVVLSDGLGSGVKANILSTLTTRIAITMLKEGAPISEVVETIGQTLPVCKVRRLAYSTFSIIQIKSSGDVYIAEFDSPAAFFLHGGKVLPIEMTERMIADKKIREARFRLDENDNIVAVSDGVIHAGIGGVLNLGWQWTNVAQYLEYAAKSSGNAESLAKTLVDVCEQFYETKPGDDTTVVTLRARKLRAVTVVVGPPKNPEDDKKVTDLLIHERGKKIVCGGTTGNIISRELKKEISVKLDSIAPDIPPIAAIDGIDLVTEGIITISHALEKLRGEIKANALEKLDGKDGATLLAKLLLEADSVNFLVGRAINPAHQNPDLPIGLGLKLKVVDEMCSLFKEAGKKVSTAYF